MESNLEASTSRLYATAIVPLLVLVVIVGLLFGLNRTFDWYLVDVDDGNMQGQDGAEWKQSMAFTVIGVYLIAVTLPSMLASVLKLLFAGDSKRSFTWSTRWPDLLALLLTIGLGVAFFLSGGAVTNFWRRLQAQSKPLKND